MSEVDLLAGVLAAHHTLIRARADLRSAVEQAHADGASWADIGTILGITRQAAFKRFGRPRDPRTGDDMTPTDLTPLIALTERAFGLIDGGDHAGLQDLMSAQAARELTRELVLDTWAQAVAESGNLTGCRDTRIEALDGTVLDPTEATLGLAVGHTTLVCEAGEWWGRVAFDADQRIVGLLVVPVDTADLPF